MRLSGRRGVAPYGDGGRGERVPRRIECTFSAVPVPTACAPGALELTGLTGGFPLRP